MIIEKRKTPRTDSHIVVEMNLPGKEVRYCGYIENISTSGMGIISLEKFMVGDKLDISFVIPGTIQKIETTAIVNRTGISMGTVYYHACHFDSLTEEQHQKITQYIQSSAA